VGLFLEQESRGCCVRRWRDDFWSFFEFRRSVTPIFNDRLLHNAWICFAIHTNFLGNFDTIGFRHQSEKKRNKK